MPAIIPQAFIPETAPFDNSQRLWLNGYLAGLLAGKGFVPVETDSNSKAKATRRAVHACPARPHQRTAHPLAYILIQK